MTLPSLGSPLPGFIHPKEWVRPTGNIDFEVTSSLADHIASGRAKGTDFWNTKCGAAVRLMLPGTCYQKFVQPMHNPPQIGDGALIARFRHPDGGNTGYAHLASFGNITVGGAYPQGHIVGLLGKTGASACHLHAHYQDAAGVHHEVYDLLEQNEVSDMLKGTNPRRINNRKTTVKIADTNFRSSPFVRADNILAKFASDALFFPDWAVDGTAVIVGGVTSKVWLAGWGTLPAGQTFGYMSELVLNPLLPIDSGYTDADLNAAKKTAANVVSAAATAAASKF